MKKALNLGCGLDLRPNDDEWEWINLDNVKPANVLFDLESCAKGEKLPFEENSLDLVLAQHVLEHLHGLLPLVEEIYRVLKPSGKFILRVPHASSDTAFGDPTHVRFFVPETILALTQPYYWRADYGYRGDFIIDNCIVLVSPELKSLKDSVLEQMVKVNRNVILELSAIMTPVKPCRPRETFIGQGAPGVALEIAFPPDEA